MSVALPLLQVERASVRYTLRGAGLLAAIELVDDKAERRFFPEIGDTGTICRNHCFKEGLVMRAIRDTMVLSPPLTITHVPPVP